MITLKPLKIGELISEKPIIQGGMGVGISLSSLAGAVAKEGGIGIISTAQIGFREKEFKEDPIGTNLKAIKSELDKARKIAPNGMIGCNIMVATKKYHEYVKAAVKAGADLIISGAGLPVRLPEFVLEAEKENDIPHHTMIAPIVSSEKSAEVILKMWDRKYKIVPDLLVIEGPLAGGHLGFSIEDLDKYGIEENYTGRSYDREAYDEEIKKIIAIARTFSEKYNKDIPVVVAGGIYTHEDVLHQIELGADGVQIGTRFVTTEECDAPDAYKQAYIHAAKEDIVITKSPVGMPGRAIKNAFLAEKKKEPIERCYQCIENCKKPDIPYCITNALVNAARGETDKALLFCGMNAYRAEKIETVKQVMEELMGKGRDTQNR